MTISGLSGQELTSSLFTTEKDEDFKPKSLYNREGWEF